MFGSGQVPVSKSDQVSDVLALHNGIPGYWLGGRFIPRMAGGSPDGDGDGSSGDGGAGGSGDTGKDGTPFDAARAQRTIEALRAEAKAAKDAAKDRDDLAARLKAIEDKDKTDSEKLSGDLQAEIDRRAKAEARATELATKYEASLIRAAIDREARKGNAVDEDAVAALVDRSAIKIDEAGNVSGVDKAVEKLLKDKPYLVDAGKGNAGGSGVRGMPTTPRSTGGGGSGTHEERVAENQRRLAGTGRYNPL